MSENPRPPKTSPFIRFLGGIDLLFALVALVLFCILIYLIKTISFVYDPFLVVLASVGTPLLLAIIFYYMFVPLVDWLEQKKVPRSFASLLSLLILLGLTISLFSMVIPTVVQQIVRFSQGLPETVNQFIIWLQQYTTSDEFQTYYTQIVNWINNSLSDIVNQFATTLGSTLQGITSILSALSSVLIALMIFPIMLYFLLMDGRKFKNMFIQIFPSKIRPEIDILFRDVNVKVGGYIKGRLLVSFLIGVYFFVTYSILNINYAFVLALLAGLLSLIPYLGSIIALVPVLIIVIPNSLVTTILALIVWSIGQILDGNILGPLIIGRNLDVHPLTILIVLLGSGALWGIVGMIIGVPVYSIFKIIFSFFFNHYKQRYIRYFGDEDQPY